jgi:two-component system chemotaxis response regulator CheY
MPPKNILIVEELPQIYQLLRPALETMGANLRVVDVSSGEEASLESLDSQVDLLVAEYQLHGMTGLELMRNVRRMHPQARTILILEGADPAIQGKITKAGANATFIKPFSDDSFLSKVKELLGITETRLERKDEKEEEKEEETGQTIKLESGVTQLRLPELLADLRQALGARAVLVLQDGCDVLARAGDLPEDIPESEYLPAILAMHSAAVRAAHAMERQANTDWHVLPGEDHDLVLYPAGGRHILLVAGSGIAASTNIVQSLDALASTRERLLQCLEEDGEEEINPQVTGSQSRKNDRMTAEQEPLVGKPGKVLSADEVDKFWEEDGTGLETPTKPDMLTYEQARQLGLVQGEES